MITFLAIFTYLLIGVAFACIGQSKSTPRTIANVIFVASIFLWPLFLVLGILVVAIATATNDKATQDFLEDEDA